MTDTKGLIGREKAAETLKNKLKFGAEGTALMGGLTVAGKYIAVPALKGVNNVIIKPTLGFVGDTVFNPIAKFAAKEKIMLPLASGFGFVTVVFGLFWVVCCNGLPSSSLTVSLPS